MRPDNRLVEPITAKLGTFITTPGAFSEAFGLTITSGESFVELAALDPILIIQLYVLFGAILFRGFKVTLEAFENFSDKFTGKYVVNGSLTRESVSAHGTTQTVNKGKQIIPPHAEMAYSPFRPEVLWFYCDTPATQDGETLICDGLDVWSNLDPRIKQLFLGRKLTYRKSFNNQEHDLNSMALFWLGQSIETSSIRETLARIPNTVFLVEDDGSFHLEYTVPAVQKPKHHDALAFANSLIVEDQTCFFENGEAISRDLRLEVFYQTAQCCRKHKWQAGDVLMVDNSRMMHGRAPFRDDQRRIFVRMGRETF